MSFKSSGKLLIQYFVIALFIYSCKSKPSIEKTKVIQQQLRNDKNTAAGSVPEYPQDDPDYNPILLKWQRDVTLYKNFELNFSGSVTLMSLEMLEAYKKRFDKMQGQNFQYDQNIVPQKRDTLSIIMTAYTSVPKFSDFDDNRLWNKSILYNDKWIEPSSITYYRNSNPLSIYFSLGSIWSRTYVLQFQIPQFDKDQIDEKETHVVQFSLQSAIAKADYYWRWCGKLVENCK